MALTLVTNLSKRDSRKPPPLAADELRRVASQLGLDVNVLQQNMQGGFGSVFIAEDHGLSRRVAIKILYKDWKPERMYRESVALRTFCSNRTLHSHLIAIYSCFETEHYFCYTMECADDSAPVGEEYTPDSLSCRIARAIAEDALPPSIDDVAVFFHQLLDALEFLHSQKLVHLDIKPDNILFVNGRLKLADYSLITSMDEVRKVPCGTPGFVPPNQRQDGKGGLDGVDQDLYALGIVLHCYADNCQTWDCVSSFSADLQAQPFYKKLNRFLLKACNVCEKERFHSVEEMRKGFDACFPRKRHWGMMAAMGVPVILLLAGLGVQAMVVFTRRQAEQAQRALWHPSSESVKQASEISSVSLVGDADRFKTKASGGFGFAEKPFQQISFDVFSESGQLLPHLADASDGEPYFYQSAQGVVLHLEAGQAVELPVKLEFPKWFEFAFFASGNVPCHVKTKLGVQEGKSDEGTDWLDAELKEEDGENASFMVVFRVICKDDVMTMMMDGEKAGECKVTNGGDGARLLLKFFSEKSGEISLSFFKIWNLSEEITP